MTIVLVAVLILGGWTLNGRDTPDPIGRSFPAARIALDALRQHESLDGRKMTGDGGLARGWLHQHRGHWIDGCGYLGVDWPWPESTHDLEKCEHVALANWCRYSYKHIQNVPELVRRFRLPFDSYRKNNDAYLKKVMRRIKK